jgi:hypothetical protein
MPIAVKFEQAVSLHRSELNDAAAMLAHTFHESPLFRVTFADRERRIAAGRAIFNAVLRDGLRYGRVYVVRNPGIVAALIVYLPGQYPMTFARKLRLSRQYAAVAIADFSGLLKILRTQKTLDGLRPQEPHIYACFAGVRKEYKILLGTMMADQLKRVADEIGFPIYGETQEERLVRWYQSLGGRVLQQGVPLYPAGPKTWTLWRDPISNA